MGVRILAGDDGACFFCSTSGFAFGPVFASEDAAERFQRYAAAKDGRDLRVLTDQQLERLFSDWLASDDQSDGYNGDN